ncbi:unnamed protein product [Calypogeia fissa]
MVLRNSRWKVSVGSGSSHSGSYQTLFRISLVIIGVSALATTLLLGSFLWGIVSRKKKKNKGSAFADLYPRASHKPNTVVALREFAKPIQSSSPKVADYDNSAFFDTLVFDAEQGYAQVLAEARSHAAAQKKSTKSNTPSPVKVSPTFNDGKHSWLPRSSSARSLSFLDDVEAMVAHKQEGSGAQRFKSPKSWKKLLFWKQSKKSNQFEFNVNGAVHSSCSTPLHYVFKSSKARATVAPTTPKRSVSGPLYTDGSPLTPTRAGRSFSGPLSASSTPNRDGLYESPYMPLRRPSSSPKMSSGPLYVT